MNVFHLPVLDWPGWQAKYRPEIRVSVQWDRLVSPPPRVGRTWWLDSKLRVYYPWYDHGDWRTGVPRRAILGTSHTILVAPALALGSRRFFLLDACHRLRGMSPRIVVLDWIDPGPARFSAFIDALERKLKLL